MTRKVTIQSIGRIVLLFAVVPTLFMASRDRGSVSPRGHHAVLEVAPPGEKTFSVRFGLKLSLPMPEKDFLTLIASHHLEYELYAERGLVGKEIPPPSPLSEVSLASIRRCYLVYGKIDRERGTGEYYLVYVTLNGQVALIENDFAYTGP